MLLPIRFLNSAVTRSCRVSICGIVEWPHASAPPAPSRHFPTSPLGDGGGEDASRVFTRREMRLVPDQLPELFEGEVFDEGFVDDHWRILKLHLGKRRPVPQSAGIERLDHLFCLSK